MTCVQKQDSSLQVEEWNTQLSYIRIISKNKNVEKSVHLYTEVQNIIGQALIDRRLETRNG